MGLLNVLSDKVEKLFDKGKEFPEIKKIEDEIKQLELYLMTGYDGREGEINRELRKKRFEQYKKTLKKLKNKSDTERIKRGLPPKYFLHIPEQEKGYDTEKFHNRDTHTKTFKLPHSKNYYGCDIEGFLKGMNERKGR